jgi:hypothetical protein
MKSSRWYIFLGVLCVLNFSLASLRAQSPSVLYTWDNTGNASPNIEQWFRSFGAANTSATLTNSVLGTLSIAETGTALGGSQAFSDDFNRVRESSTGASGGLDLTGLSSLQFDLGHNGAGNVSVQFYVQATTGSSFVALGPDVAVAPGINTYTLPLTGLTAPQAVYIRTIGLNIRDHAAEGNLTWSLNEVRSVGAGLAARDLATFNTGTAEGGLQGAIVNFDGASVLNNTGQNQSGLSQNPAGSGSLQWIDVAGGAGAAVSLGNGTAWNGNTFNNRTTDLSNYQTMIVRVSATETATTQGGTLSLTPFFQANNFGTFNSLTAQSFPIDGQFHDLVFTIPVLANMNVVDQTGLNFGSHANELQINVDLVRFEAVPEPATLGLIGLALVGVLGTLQRSRGGSC